MVAHFQKPIAELLLDFGDELLDCIRDAKRIDVDDVRAAMLDPLRRQVKGQKKGAG